MVYIPGQSFNPYGVPPIMGESTPLPYEVPVLPNTTPMPAPAPSPAPAPTPAPAPPPAPAPTDFQGRRFEVATPPPAGVPPELLGVSNNDVRVTPALAVQRQQEAMRNTPMYMRVRLPSLDIANERGGLDWHTNANDQQGYYFVTNRGRSAGTRASRHGFVPLGENFQYRLTDERGNEIVASGTGEQGLQDVYAMAQRLSAEQGRAADWNVEVLDPSVGNWVVYADDDPPGSDVGGVLGTVLDVGLPALGALALGPASGVVGAALGSGLGSVASSQIQNRRLGDTLARAGLTAATSGLLQGTQVGRDITGTLSDAVEGVVSPVLSDEAARRVAEGVIEVTGRRALPAAVSGATGSLVSGPLADVVLPEVDTPSVAEITGEPVPEEPIVVTGDPTGRAIEPTGLVSGLGPDMVFEDPPIIVEGTVEDIPADSVTIQDIAPIAGIGAGGALTTTGGSTPAGDGRPISEVDVPSAPITEYGVPSSGGFNLGNLDLADYLNIAGLATGTLGNLVAGGAGGGGGGTIPAGLFTSGGAGSGALPAPNIPGLTAGPGVSYARQDLGDVDWSTYGMGPEQSMFSYVPRPGEGALPMPAPAPAPMPAPAPAPMPAVPSITPTAPPIAGTVQPSGYSSYTDPVTGVTYDTVSDTGMRPKVSPYKPAPMPADVPVMDVIGPKLPRVAKPAPMPADVPVMDVIRKKEDMARGGLVHYMRGGNVTGLGDGRQDLIPAMLSDGEYVIDAETVALLGNGSSKAGADALDRFRVNLRKHKGKQLARGGFSSNAKSPMHYLDGAAG